MFIVLEELDKTPLLTSSSSQINPDTFGFCKLRIILTVKYFWLSFKATWKPSLNGIGYTLEISDSESEKYHQSYKKGS